MITPKVSRNFRKTSSAPGVRAAHPAIVSFGFAASTTVVSTIGPMPAGIDASALAIVGSSGRDASAATAATGDGGETDDGMLNVGERDCVADPDTAAGDCVPF